MANETPVGGLDVDDRITIKGTYTDINGDPASIDISQIDIIVEPPTGGSYLVDDADITINNGTVSFKVDLDEGGTWKWRMKWSAVTGAQTKTGSIRVRSHRVADPD